MTREWTAARQRLAEAMSEALTLACSDEKCGGYTDHGNEAFRDADWYLEHVAGTTGNRMLAEMQEAIESGARYTAGIEHPPCVDLDHVLKVIAFAREASDDEDDSFARGWNAALNTIAKHAAT